MGVIGPGSEAVREKVQKLLRGRNLKRSDVPLGWYPMGRLRERKNQRRKRNQRMNWKSKRKTDRDVEFEKKTGSFRVETSFKQQLERLIEFMASSQGGGSIWEKMRLARNRRNIWRSRGGHFPGY